MRRSGIARAGLRGVGVSLALMLGPALPVWVLAQAQNVAPATPPGQTQPQQVPAPTTPDQATPAPDTTEAQPGAETSSLELVRKSDTDGQERRIRIVRTGTSDDTGIFALCSPQEEDPKDAPTLAVFSETGPGGVLITIDKNVIRVPLAVVTQRQPKDGEDGSDGRVEASAGTARFLNDPPADASERLTRCGVEASPKAVPDAVFVTQGKTELKGQKLVYDETDGIARIEGPVTFRRANETDPLTGSAERIEVNVDEETTTLVGNVVLNSEGGRVSRAGRVVYDDAANLARLIGTPEQPAVSVKGGDTLRAGMILYDLEKNEVYAVKAEGGTITGEFVEGGDEPGTSSAPATTPRPQPPGTSSGTPDPDALPPVPTDPALPPTP
jgi:hypothetical protein